MQSYGPLTKEPVPISENVAQVCGAVSHALYDLGSISPGKAGGLASANQEAVSGLSKVLTNEGPELKLTGDQSDQCSVLKVITMEIKVLRLPAGTSQPDQLKPTQSKLPE